MTDLYNFKVGDRVQINLGDELLIGTVIEVCSNPNYDPRFGGRYPSLYNVLWDGDKIETKGYLPFLLDRYFPQHSVAEVEANG